MPANKPTEKPRLGGTSAAARESNRSENTIRRWCEEGKIPYVLDVNRRRIFDLNELARLRMAKG